MIPPGLGIGVGGGDERGVVLGQRLELLVGQGGGRPAGRETGDQPEDPVVVDDVDALETGDGLSVASGGARFALVAP